MRPVRRSFLFGLFFLLLFDAARASASNSVVPGTLIVDPPTLACLGFAWPIQGDDNRNATVETAYRRAGDTAWKPGLPLLRTGGERITEKGVNLDYPCPHLFAGSLFDLAPETAYECRFTLRDPDGVKGTAIRTVRAKTRPAPRAYGRGRVLHVYPPDYEGPRKEPSFIGIKKAYYHSGAADWSVVSEEKVLPGDILEVHAGLYKADRLKYGDELAVPFHGAYVLTVKGTPEKPITIRAAGDGEVIFDGAGCYRLFDVMAGDYHIFENLTIRNCDIAFYAGLKDVAGCKGLTVRNCRMENIGIGVVTEFAGSRDFCIADNVMIGRNDGTRLRGWYNEPDSVASKLYSYYGAKVYGSGHVICHNFVTRFHDGLCICTHGSPEEDPALVCASIDIYNNDIFHVSDDFIESDGGVRNIRVLRNRGFNSAQCGLSAQPIYGGPAYFIRNILYQVPWGAAFKFKSNPAGLLVYHNTVCAENTNSNLQQNIHFRNNLILGTGHPDRELFFFSTPNAYSTFDYNGYAPFKSGKPPFAWRPLAWPAGVTDTVGKKLKPLSFATLDEFREASGHEIHGIEVTYDIFQKVVKPDPAAIRKIYPVADFDFSLKPGSAAVDAGCVLPNVNDGFAGRAPDLGALELGEASPVYGPRP